MNLLETAEQDSLLFHLTLFNSLIPAQAGSKVTVKSSPRRGQRWR